MSLMKKECEDQAALSTLLPDSPASLSADESIHALSLSPSQQASRSLTHSLTLSRIPTGSQLHQKSAAALFSHHICDDEILLRVGLKGKTLTLDSLKTHFTLLHDVELRVLEGVSAFLVDDFVQFLSYLDPSQSYSSQDIEIHDKFPHPPTTTHQKRSLQAEGYPKYLFKHAATTIIKDQLQTKVQGALEAIEDFLTYSEADDVCTEYHCGDCPNEIHTSTAIGPSASHDQRRSHHGDLPASQRVYCCEDCQTVFYQPQSAIQHWNTCKIRPPKLPTHKVSRNDLRFSLLTASEPTHIFIGLDTFARFHYVSTRRSDEIFEFDVLKGSEIKLEGLVAIIYDIPTLSPGNAGFSGVWRLAGTSQASIIFKSITRHLRDKYISFSEAKQLATY